MGNILSSDVEFRTINAEKREYYLILIVGYWFRNECKRQQKNNTISTDINSIITKYCDTRTDYEKLLDYMIIKWKLINDKDTRLVN